MDPEHDATRSGDALPGGPPPNDARVIRELRDRAQESLAAEHFVRACTEKLLGTAALEQDAEASMLVALVHGQAESHVEGIEALLEQIDGGPSRTRKVVGTGLGTALGWLERLPNRDLPEIVRDVYLALQYTAAGYHILFTRALLLGRTGAAGLARRHLTDYTQAIAKLTELLAWAAALELPIEHWHGAGPMRQIVATLDDVWRRGRADAP